jgi:hypothetical protein
MATVRDASVHVAGVVNGVAYAGGLPDHVPFAVTGEQESTEEQPVSIAAPGIPDVLTVDGEAAVRANDANVTPAVVFEKLDPPPPPKPRYLPQPLPAPPPP